jgi:hypothetical protein
LSQLERNIALQPVDADMNEYLKEIVLMRFLDPSTIMKGSWFSCQSCWICEKWGKVKLVLKDPLSHYDLNNLEEVNF